MIKVKPTGPIPADIMICGEAPGEHEEDQRLPFVGPSGAELTRMLGEAGISRSACFVTNIVPYRPPNNDISAFIPSKKKDISAEHVECYGIKCLPVVVEGVEDLKKQILAVKPKVILALGATALLFLTGKKGITNWRGSTLPCTLVPGSTVVPTYHPAAILRQWSLRYVAVHDFRRALRVVRDGVVQANYAFILRPNYSTVLSTLHSFLDEASNVQHQHRHGNGDSSNEPIRLLEVDRKVPLEYLPIHSALCIHQPLRVDVDNPQQGKLPNPVQSAQELRPNLMHEPEPLLPRPKEPQQGMPSAIALPTGPNALQAPNEYWGNTSGTLPNPIDKPYLRVNPSNKKPLRLAADIETRNGHIVCIGFAWSDRDAICIPFTSFEGHYWSIEEEANIIVLLQRVLTHPNIDIIGQNFIYDSQYIYRHWLIEPRCASDTMLTHHLCFPELPKSLDFMASLYCDQYIFWKLDGKTWLDNLDESQLWRYNCEDCVRTFEIDLCLQAIVDKLNLREQWKFQMSLFPAVLRTMVIGIRFDTSQQLTVVEELKTCLADNLKWLETVIGHPFNPESSKQVQEFFYTEMGQPPYHNRKTGALTADDEAIRKCGIREPLLMPVSEKIAECRTLNTFISTFLSDKLDVDKRIRCAYNIAGTVTFRFSSSENAFGSGLNLQNIPK